MGRIIKKGDRGIATQFLTRNQAIRRLQVSLSDFRKICILKGIHPREPRKKKHLKRGVNKTYYHVKDIQYLSHEPILDRFKEFRVYLRRVKRAIGRKDYFTARQLKLRKPTYKLDLVIKERYPTLQDALRDLDDALSTIALFSTMTQIAGVQGSVIHACSRLITEFQLYVIQTKCLRKVFLSIKGIYFQCSLMGEVVTWVAPHEFTTRRPADVDFRLMLTFVEFYINLIGFVNFHLYQKLNLTYPPRIPGRLSAPPHLHIHKAHSYLFRHERYDTLEQLSYLNHSIESAGMDVEGEEVELDPELTPIEGEEEAAARESQRREEQLITAQQSLFADCYFYLDREVSKCPLVLCIRSCGGRATWEGDTRHNTEVSDEDITHHVTDRGTQLSHVFLLREYVQPQWVFDSVNNRRCMGFGGYRPGDTLPPHLSPFMQELEGDYIPPERLAIIEMEGGDIMETAELSEAGEEVLESVPSECVPSESVPTESVPSGGVKKRRGRHKALGIGSVIRGQTERETQGNSSLEEDKLREMLLSKKKRRLYDKLKGRDKKRTNSINKLRERRKQIERKKMLENNNNNN